MPLRMRFGIGVCLALLAAACGSSSSPTSPQPTPTPTPNTGNAVVNQMLAGLSSQIASALATNQDNLPRNPGNAAQIQAKIALLQRPTLASEIVGGNFYVTATATSMRGTVTFAAVFPMETMRSEASGAVQQLATALPILEQFMGRAFPTDAVRVWYGFIVGNSGGGGVINTEDQSSYESSTPASRLPLEAILDHELSHSYISHEGLNQFLEIYQMNVVHTGSTDPTAWSYARANVGSPPASTASSAALLDVYRLIGRDAMASAYRIVYPLNPPYGDPLSSACKQAFVDQAPEALKPRVAALVANVVY